MKPWTRRGSTPAPGSIASDRTGNCGRNFHHCRRGLNMKLSCGKEDRLDLEHVPLESRVVRGVRIFEPKRTSEARAAVLTNNVVARTFQKAVHPMDKTGRAAVRPDRIDVATFRDESGKL